MNPLQTKLKEWREREGLSQPEGAQRLAKLLKIPVGTGTLRGWEQGRRLPRGMLVFSILKAIEPKVKKA